MVHIVSIYIASTNKNYVAIFLIYMNTYNDYNGQLTQHVTLTFYKSKIQYTSFEAKMI